MPKVKYLDFGNDYENSLALFRESYDLYQKAGDPLRLAFVSNNIGIVLNQLGKPDLALNEYETSLKILKRYIGDHNRMITMIYYNMGRTHLSMGNDRLALDKFNLSLNINKLITHSIGEASDWFGIGLYHEKKGNFHKAIEAFTKSLNICKNIGYINGVISLYFSLGTNNLKVRNLEQSLYWTLNYLGLSKKINLPQEKGFQLIKKILESEVHENLKQEILTIHSTRLDSDLRPYVDIEKLLSL